LERDLRQKEKAITFRGLLEAVQPRDADAGFPRRSTRRENRACDQNGERPDPERAFSSVVTKYSSRSRSNFACVALKLATRAAISSRS
jgi:hypothetical protein